MPMENFEKLKLKLDTEFIGKNIKFIEEAGSSNDEVKKYDIDGTVVVCENQTAGRGRQGHVWHSPSGSGLLFSILLKPDILIEQAPQITLISGISVCRALKKLAGIRAGIKWPNDIIINNKKAAGILTEMNSENNKIKYVVTGIGINVNTPSFPKELQEKAISLKMYAGREFKRKELLKFILEEFEILYKKYIREKSFKSFADEYKALCVNIGKDVSVGEISGFACGISDSGELIIKTKDGTIKNIFAGEVNIRRSDGGYI